MMRLQKRTADGGKAGASSKKSKKDKTGTSATGKGAKSDSAAAINAPRVKPDLPMPSLYAHSTHFCKFRTWS